MPAKRWSVSQPETQVKSALASEWDYMNPILGRGEPGYVLDTGVLKIGDGETPFDSLAPVGGEVEAPVDAIAVVEHGDDANYPRPDSITVVYWLGTVEPLNAIEDDLLSLEVDTP